MDGLIHILVQHGAAVFMCLEASLQRLVSVTEERYAAHNRDFTCWETDWMSGFHSFIYS